MAGIPGMEMKYTIIKNEDVNKHLDDRDKSELSRILWKIEQGRYEEGKEASNTYIMINTDEPYVNEVIEIMKSNGQWDNADDPNQVTALMVNDELILPEGDSE